MINPGNGMQMRKNNIHTLFSCIKENEPLSKRELQEMTNMSWGVISTISSMLCDNRYVVPVGKQNTSVGRKPCELDINPNYNYIIGIDLNISYLCGVVTDLKGRIVQEWIRYFTYNTYDYVMNLLLSLLDEITKKYENREIVGIGLAMQGLVDIEQGVSIRLPQVRDWKDVPLRNILEERYQYPVLMMHDPYCIMTAEKAFGASSMRIANHAILLRIDNGIGMSMLINGQIYTGSDGKAGEFGHVSINRNGPLCVCGKRGCIEEYASCSGLLRQFTEQVNAGRRTSVAMESTGMNFQTLVAGARNKDALCSEIFSQMGENLGFSLAMVINILAPDLVVLYGGLTEYRDLYYEKLCEHLDCYLYKGISAKVQFSELGKNAAAQGVTLAVSERAIIGFVDELARKSSAENENMYA